eukprot:250344_1
MANLMMSAAHHLQQINQLIENARSITDLNVIIKQLVPLPELKKILLNKLSTLQTKTNEQNGNNNIVKDNSVSLHSLYFNSYPFDEIFSDDIICSVIEYLSGSKMYHKLPQINKNFNKLMRGNPNLYQQYKIQVTLSDDMWSNNTKKLYINYSHQLQIIEISTTLQHSLPCNSLIPLNSKIAPDQSRTNDSNYNTFIIRSVDDMTKKCPFVWYGIRTWQIITHLSDYDHNTLLSTPPINNNNNNNNNTTFSNNNVSFPDINTIPNKNRNKNKNKKK